MNKINTPSVTAISTHAIFFSVEAVPQQDILRKQKRICALGQYCLQSNHFIDVVPANNNLTLYLKDPNQLNNWLVDLVKIWDDIENVQLDSQHHQIITHYGGEHGPDLEAVANYHKLTPEQVIKRHTEATYHVLFLGFQPGFAYLHGLALTLHTPRRNEPRVRIPKGSVAIGGSQTGIYPSISPGGWHIIGHTDFALFDINNPSPCAIKPGDTLEFIAKDAY
ncbi:5-oxoprolinase subunit PxpB [Pseudoalteromonas mariniglutinosa]|uniref:5-oxoprolinase subunit PxpB n=1 Tax=Pseudoalteromonas mariniglutinosa TaxID=206042 RepID=UPI00384DDF8D